jgi:hypothetical protein
MYKSFIVLALVVTTSTTHAELSRRLSNGVGVTPAMGFNNWNAGLRKDPLHYFINLAG